MNENVTLSNAWEILLNFTEGVVAVRTPEKKVVLAHVDGAYFSLVAKDIQHLDAPPEMVDYNVAMPWMWALFREPHYTYLRCVAGRIRDPTVDCLPDMSWAPVHEHHKRDALQLATKAAKLTLRSDLTAEATKTEAWNFLQEIERFMLE
tara:strand:+ start:379 stop:825 length:447 start_codon:yes stop_codon:yes gene_type:complete